MKYRFLTWFLLVVVVVNVLRFQLPYWQYNAFKGYIAKNLCENRFKKNCCCHGKCFLKKQLNLANESNSSNENNRTKKNVNTEEKEFLSILPETLSAAPLVVKILRLIYLESARLQGFVFPVFQPPKY